LAERLIPSEAIELVGRMLRGFPNKDKLSAGYAGAMAELLMSYPKMVATACADPIHGVVHGLKFMPVPSDVIAWCENRLRPLQEEADREVRVKKQIEDVDAWRTMTVPESLKAKGRAWLDRTDPVAQEVSGQKPKIVTEEQRAVLIESARQAGKELAGLRLRPETLATLGAMPPYCGPPAATAVAAASPQSDDEVIFGV